MRTDLHEDRPHDLSCSPQIVATLVRTASRSPWLETVLMMKTAANRSGHDTVALANPVAAQHRRDARAIRNTRPQARVWTPAIVMRHPLPKDASTSPSFNRIIQSRHSRRIVPITRSQNAFHR
jgi:hypothetical protein